MRIPSLLLAILIAASARADDRGTGALGGMVRLTGRPPEIASREVSFNTDVCGSEARTVPSLLLGTNQAVANVIVYLGVNTTLPHAGNGSTNVIEVGHCEFFPRVQVMASGMPLLMRNDDPVLHVMQVEMLGATNTPTVLTTIPLPYAGHEHLYAVEAYREPHMLKIQGGNGEEGMVGYVAVLPHRWVAVTDSQGRFTIHNVPPGHYKLFAWHEILGTLTREVTVNVDHTTAADIEFASPINP